MAEGNGGPLVLGELSWPEVRELLPQVEMALIPVGSFEQHGPNLALRCDAALGEAASRRISARLYPRVLVAPTVPWGISPHHMRFPGTITLQPETLVAVLGDIVRSLQQHGIRRFLFVNSHGGNEATVAMAANKLRYELEPSFIGTCNYYRAAMQGDLGGRVKSEFTGHSCELEVSWAMYLAPEIVKRATLSPGKLVLSNLKLRKLGQESGVSIPFRFDQLTENGCLGDATQASVELGRDTFEAALERICLFVEAAIEATP